MIWITLIVSLLSAPAAERQIVILGPEQGPRVLSGEQAASYTTTASYLQDRWIEAASIKTGSRWADLVAVYMQDGGLTDNTHRYVLILCPYIKVDVKFDQPPGPTARVTSISRPYFAPPQYD